MAQATVPLEHSELEVVTTASHAVAEPQPAGIAALGINGPLLAAQIINFLIVLAVLRAVAYKPLLAMLAKRRAMVEESVAQAAKTEQEARASQETAATLLASARTEAATILATAKERAEAAGAAIIAEAHETAARQLAAASQQIDRERQAMLAAAEQELGGLVVAAAERVVGSWQLAVTPAEVETALREERHA